MINSLIGTKLSASQTFTETGMRIPVTMLSVGPCPVVQIKTIEKDGYNAVQIGAGIVMEKKLTKPGKGHLIKTGKAQKTFPKFLREIPVFPDTDTHAQPLQVGDVLTASTVFAVGDAVKVTGISKGKGFAGAVKRHGFAGGPHTHGQSDRERAPGSIGQTTTPGRVYKGKRMAGRMGADTVTIRGLQIVAIDAQKHVVAVKGVVPGNIGGLVTIAKQ